VIALFLLGGIWWLAHRASPQGPAPASATSSTRRPRGGGSGNNPILPVGVAPAQKGDLALYLNGLGTVTPLHAVTVRTQISGQLMQLGFQEGQLVQAGDLLAVIDPRPYENALTQAQGQLRQAQSQLEKARLDLQRYRTLAKEDSIAQQQVDTVQSQVTQYEGLVQTSQAAIDTAKLNLDYCHIKAPVDGRVGLRQIDVGNYVTAGDPNGLVVLTQIKPITVLFTLPEDNIGPIAARLRTGAKLTVDAFDRTQSRQLATGTLATIDNQIDPATGTFKLRAEFANEDESLFSNQFVNVRLLVDTVRDAVVIPSSAVERGQQGAYVYVIQPGDTVAAKPISLGATEGERVAVTSGLTLGDRIVVDGADKLKDGMKVLVAGQDAPPRGASKRTRSKS
jgi:multidrug efflux system membrane fusion protein